MFFRASPSKTVYRLTAYSLSRYFGEIGGLLILVYAFGFALTRCFVSHSLDKNLIYDSYQAQGYTENSSEFYKSLTVRDKVSALRNSNKKKK